MYRHTTRGLGFDQTYGGAGSTGHGGAGGDAGISTAQDISSGGGGGDINLNPIMLGQCIRLAFPTVPTSSGGQPMSPGFVNYNGSQYICPLTVDSSGGAGQANAAVRALPGLAVGSTTARNGPAGSSSAIAGVPAWLLALGLAAGALYVLKQ